MLFSTSFIWMLFVVVVTFGQMPPKPPIIPLVNDIPFIKCDVCKRAAKSLYKSVKSQREKIAPVKFSICDVPQEKGTSQDVDVKNQLSEEEILNIVEKSCNPDDSDFGHWIAKLDIIESDNTLILQEHSKIGRCREECKTIQRTCEDTIGDIDTDIGELLWKDDIKLSKFINYVCHEETNACSKVNKKYKKGKRKDFKFVEMTEKDIEAANMMKNMKGAPGMPGLEMYTPEDLENMRDQLGLDDYKDQIDAAKAARSQKQQQQEQQQEHSKADGSHAMPSASLGFFDMVKAMGSDVVKKVKGVFGMNTKSEL